MNTIKQFDTDVLVIGTGPTGSVTALALATNGIKVHMVSRENWLANSPRAHITNQRTMEVMRALDIEEELYRSATPWDLMGDSMITTSFAGEEIARIRSWGTDPHRKSDYLTGSPCELLDIPQPVIEPVLYKNAAERGATSSFNTEYISHIQDDHGVTVTLRDLLQDRQYTVRAKYLVGADGGSSMVAKDINLNVEGEHARAATVYAMFHADLSKYVEHRPSILHWIVNPDASFGEIGMGLMRAVVPWKYWVAGWGFDPKSGRPDLSEKTVKDRIRLYVGDPDHDVDIDMTSVWYVNEAYATECSKGRVFCGGDATHRHPPSSGLGLNTCVQDAFNLAWKLTYVLKGYAGKGLLNTYTSERAPVGKQIVLRANQSRRDYAVLHDALRVSGADNPVQAGLDRLKAKGAEGVAAREALNQALLLKNEEFSGQGVEMNQRYESTAVIIDKDHEKEVWEKSKVEYLKQTSRPGAKIPHAWLVGKDGKRVSTLDLTGKGFFTLVTGIAGDAWKEAVLNMSCPYLNVLVIGEEGAKDLYCEWQRIREVSEAGAILVRPDGYVAWRDKKGISSSAEAQDILSKVLSSILDTNH